MSRFTLPRDIYHGKGCLEELKNLKGKKAILVVGGGSMKRQGFLDKAVGYLKEAGMEAVKIGITVSGNKKMITGRDEERYLDRPVSDELMNWWQKELSEV